MGESSRAASERMTKVCPALTGNRKKIDVGGAVGAATDDGFEADRSGLGGCVVRLSFCDFRQRVDAEDARIADAKQTADSHVIKSRRDISTDSHGEGAGNRIAAGIAFLSGRDFRVAEDHGIKFVQVRATSHNNIHRGATLGSRRKHRCDASLRQLGQCGADSQQCEGESQQRSSGHRAGSGGRESSQERGRVRAAKRVCSKR